MAITQAVAPGERVAFDITHGLRSLPLVGLLAAAFLQSARQIELEAVLYGAYDVRDQSVTPNRTPMFDLTPMLALLRWANATDRFKRFGDGRDLADLLLAVKDRAVRQSGGDPSVIEQVRGLNSTAGTLRTASLALRLTRVNEALQAAARIPDALDRARPAFEAAAAVQPFQLLADDIKLAMEPLALETPEAPCRLTEVLSAQRRVIAWYVEKQQLVQAVTLGREWLVSWAMVWLGERDLLDQELRDTVSNTLNSEAHRWRNLDKKDTFKPLWFQGAPDLPTALAVWNELAGVRNDIDHAGMRRGAQSADVLAKRVTELCKRLHDLPLPDEQSQRSF